MLQLDKPTPFLFRHVKKVDIYKESRPVSDVGKQVDINSSYEHKKRIQYFYSLSPQDIIHKIKLYLTHYLKTKNVPLCFNTVQMAQQLEIPRNSDFILFYQPIQYSFI